jgi:hypothetical protein
MAIRNTNVSHIKNGNIGLFMLLLPRFMKVVRYRAAHHDDSPKESDTSP